MKKLPIGDGMPILGLGTWKSDSGEVGEAVQTAIKIGYRHIDCAAIYGNEAEIGEAIADCISRGDVTRDELWITSKLWNTAHRPDDVRPALEKTLRDLRLDDLDLYLIHWPVALEPGTEMPPDGGDFIPPSELSILDTWRALESAREAGLTRHLGVSNFSVVKLSKLLGDAAVAPVVNQVELHPYLQQQDLVNFCDDHGIHLTAYSPLGSKDRPDSMKQEDEPILLEDPVIKDIADKRGVTEAQVLLAWALARGTAAIPKSTHPERLAENLAAADVQLEAGDLARIAELDKHRRYVDGSFWAVDGSPHTVRSLWDR